MLRFIALSLNQVLGSEEKRSSLLDKKGSSEKGLIVTLSNDCRRTVIRDDLIQFPEVEVCPL